MYWVGVSMNYNLGRTDVMSVEAERSMKSHNWSLARSKLIL
jgi:hypothetical protein